MTERIIFVTFFIAFALLKLGELSGIIQRDRIGRQPWTEHVGPAVLFYLGIHILGGISIKTKI